MRRRAGAGAGALCGPREGCYDAGMVTYVPCRLRPCNVRTFVDASFPLDGLWVVLGENATGRGTRVDHER